MAVKLPVVFGEAIDELRRALAERPYELVLSVGLSPGRGFIGLERVAINIDDARFPDNAGNLPIDEAIVKGGPAAYFSTLPIKTCLHALTEAGIHAEVSHSAGTYVCNHVFYGLMNAVANLAGTKAGFIHVPYSPEQVTNGVAPSMTVSEVARGLEIIALTSLSTDEDLRITAGTID